MPDRSTYIHGVTPAEQARLAILNRLLNPDSLRQLAVRPGDRVLDVGSGLGDMARAIGRISGVPVVGVERSPEQLAQAVRAAKRAGESGLAAFRQGDAERLPLSESEWGGFDVVHCRFLLEHLPDPAAAVSQMVRASRPGGRIVLEDDDHDVMRLSPEVESFGPIWRAYVASYERVGNDPYVGRRLVSLLAGAGARPARNQWLFFGGCAGERDFPAFVENLAGVLESAREAVLSQRLCEPDAFDRAVADIRAWGRLPDAALWYSVCWAEGIRP